MGSLRSSAPPPDLGHLDDESLADYLTDALDRGRVAYDGDAAGVVGRAEGLLWTVVTAGPPPEGDVTVVSARRQGAAMRYQVVASSPPGAEPAEPGLEDGYVALMRAVRDPAPA